MFRFGGHGTGEYIVSCGGEISLLNLVAGASSLAPTAVAR
jgi:hypothetical protein